MSDIIFKALSTTTNTYQIHLYDLLDAKYLIIESDVPLKKISKDEYKQLRLLTNTTGNKVNLEIDSTLTTARLVEFKRPYRQYKFEKQIRLLDLLKNMSHFNYDSRGPDVPVCLYAPVISARRIGKFWSVLLKIGDDIKHIIFQIIIKKIPKTNLATDSIFMEPEPEDSIIDTVKGLEGVVNNNGSLVSINSPYIGCLDIHNRFGFLIYENSDLLKETLELSKKYNNLLESLYHKKYRFKNVYNLTTSSNLENFSYCKSSETKTGVEIPISTSTEKGFIDLVLFEKDDDKSYKLAITVQHSEKYDTYKPIAELIEIPKRVKKEIKNKKKNIDTFACAWLMPMLNLFLKAPEDEFIADLLDLDYTLLDNSPNVFIVKQQLIKEGSQICSILFKMFNYMIQYATSHKLIGLGLSVEKKSILLAVGNKTIKKLYRIHPYAATSCITTYRSIIGRCLLNTKNKYSVYNQLELDDFDKHIWVDSNGNNYPEIKMQLKAMYVLEKTKF